MIFSVVSLLVMLARVMLFNDEIAMLILRLGAHSEVVTILSEPHAMTMELDDVMSTNGGTKLEFASIVRNRAIHGRGDKVNLVMFVD